MRDHANVIRAALVLALCSGGSLAFAEPASVPEVDGSELPAATASDGVDTRLASRDGMDTASVGLEKKKRVDLSRFSNGPRWVPKPRGRALSRATELGSARTRRRSSCCATDPR